ncbi:MAG: ParA family protein [Deltaproteobacteria bacterium]|nr:ParA family protein [Deltaproteobacteria bacterium]
MSSRVIAIANQKGGVGKTTTAVNLAASLAAAERRTLVIDVDPQANATSGLGHPVRDVARSVYDWLLERAAFDEVALGTELQTLRLVPSTPALAGAEIELVEVGARESRLRTVLASVRDRFDYVLVDCPPSLGLLTLNALVAADSVMVPLQCEYYALEGLSHLVETIERVRDRLNPALRVEGVLLTMFDGRNSLAREVADEVRGHFAGRVFETVIPRNVRLSEAPSHGRPILLYDVQSKGCKGYLELAKELMTGNGAA